MDKDIAYTDFIEILEALSKIAAHMANLARYVKFTPEHAQLQEEPLFKTCVNCGSMTNRSIQRAGRIVTLCKVCGGSNG